MIYLIIFAYLFVGTIASVAMETNDEISIIPVLFWPLILLILCIFGLFYFAVTIGEKIRESLG